MINKILKNIKWEFQKKTFKSIGNDCKVGIGFSVSGNQYISIGDNFRAGKNVIIDAFDSYLDQTFTPNIFIGNNVTITDNCYISCANNIIINDGVLIGVNTFITDNFHGNSGIEEIDIIPSKRNLSSKGPVIIGKNVWIGRNVCIMPGIKVGFGAIIGANAVVTKDIPPYAIAGGVPAKVIKYRYEPEIIE